MLYRILYYGGESSALELLKDGLPETINLIVEPNRQNHLEVLHKYSPHAILLPFKSPYPEPDDLVYLQILRAVPHIPAIIVIAHNLTVSQAVCVMRNGAYDCLVGALSGSTLGMIVNRLMCNFMQKQSISCSILGKSQVITNLKEQIGQYAQWEFPTLITGETGSGKDLAARTIHNLSSRQKCPFVPVNCAAYSDDLLSTEFFGSLRGAFTGSIDRTGLFEYANEGTLFLDEIGELSLQGQAKLLRVLEEEAIRRMGSNALKKINVRILLATNQNIKHLIEIKKFRMDLFYRINLLHIKVPPLRKHKEDIPMLARSYLSKLPDVTSEIDAGAIKILLEYDWPGNVRELQSVVLKAAIQAMGKPIRAQNISFDY